MKLKHLESALSDLTLYSQLKPGTARLDLEQYSTSPHIAARMLFTAQMEYEDIENMNVLDMGCGTGILGIAASLLGAGHVLGIDIDENILHIAATNAERCKVNDVFDLLCCDVRMLDTSNTRDAKDDVFPPISMSKAFDTVIMNPPFGTRRIGADMEFLKVGVELAKRSVYSLHKTSTRSHVLKYARELGVEVQVLAQVNFGIPNTYAHHKKKSVDVEVDLIRLSIP